MSGESIDFNDVHLACGLDAVADSFQRFIAKLPVVVVSSAPPSDCEPPEYFDDIPDDLESPPPSAAGSDDESEYLERMGRYSIKKMLEQFWYVWGTDTCWDNIARKQIRLSHLRHGVGRDRYKAWDESARRKTVWDIVFEPGQELGPRVVNLYDGIKLQPDSRGSSGCGLIVKHIHRLCGGRDDEFDWLMKWIAYPLQNPGAKMASSVIMYGSEGPGKSIIWEEVVKKIYGEFSVTIGQSQLESQFTGWKSRRCFALAEEVVSRSERNHHKGMLKQTVTGSTHMINEKMLPEREESNHMNFVFLSNSTVPLELDMGDRRYLVLYVDKKPPKEYFKDLFEEIKGGGVECFYQLMLSLDLGDFTPHTEPPVNDEKDELIAASLPSPAYFHKLWKAGELDIPYMSAVSGDLFRYFHRWCERTNEFKRTERYFGSELKRVMPQVRTSIKYPGESSGHITKRIYLADENDQGNPEKIAEQCRNFKHLLETGNEA